MLEASISSAILAVTLFTALTVTHAATRASNRSVVAASQDAETTRRLDLLRRVLARAGASTLTAVPAKSVYGGNVAAEPMLDGVVYDNLRFREPIGFQEGASLYDPPLGDEPRRLELVRAEAGAGDFVFVDGERETVLATDVTAVTFHRSGDAIEVELRYAGLHHDQAEIVRRTIVALHAR